LLTQWQHIHECFTTESLDVDLLDQEKLEHLFSSIQPEVVVHCAEMTSLDLCELNPNRAFLINETATANLARATAAFGARLIAISTSAVFSGEQKGELKENNPTHPNTVYGKSKLAAEKTIKEICQNYIIVRTGWLYGSGGPSFVHSMIALAAAHPLRTLTLVNDLYGTPTPATEVAKVLTTILQRPELTGTFHISCEGATTWYEFAKTIFRVAGYFDISLEPCSITDIPRPAKRPRNVVLSKEKLKSIGLPKLPPWQEALAQFIHQEWHL
jgi:dTDP-4-dehydrorhamnose reductase